ncbi:MAG: L,D-transpeptidase family protein [Gammaproteobacteria bacterium SHHR-1]|uniref:L,D-transpeptidase family protein n=1 Tax=Magnetovirga frankeli TaxID=947516 RepID=UPI001AF7F699|nr:L,D-transpeptidase family protein [gamma proteobacterium SS-5]
MRQTIPFIISSLLLLALSAPLLAVFDPLADLERSMAGNSSLQHLLRRQLGGRSQGALLSASDWAQLVRFYHTRDYQTLWILDQRRPADWIEQVLERVRATPFTGIGDEWLVPFSEFRPDAPLKQRLVEYELRFSELLLTYARTLAVGRLSPKRYDPDWLIKSQDYSVQGFLGQVVRGEQSLLQLLDGLPPRHAGYQRLTQVYGYYRAIAERGGWASLPQQIPLLRPGDSSRWVPALRRRIKAEFSFNSLEPEDSPRYESDLVAAVRAFQWRNGLTADGVVGPATRAELDVPVEQRLRSIIASLERWRWLPRNLDGRFLMVNIPAFELTLYEGDNPFWTTRVIVGRKERPSPSISSTITQLKVNPKWHVPESISIRDLVPKQLSNPKYLQQSGYQVLLRDMSQVVDPAEIDWAYYLTAEDFPYLLRQEAGESNALGRLKFEMPSAHAIYLHDTPSRNLFEREQRAYSSGCVRVQQPYELAGMLLNKTEPVAGRRQLIQAIEAGETKYIGLPEKIPVYLTYFTTWVDEQGQAHFRRDIYGRNEKFADVSVLSD